VTDDDQADFLQSLSARTRACLLNGGLTSIESLASKNVRQLLLLPNFNRRALQEVAALLASFGMVPLGEPPLGPDPLPGIAARRNLKEEDCRRLRMLHSTLRQQQRRREAIRKEFEARLARADERIKQTQQAGAALSNELAIAIGDNWDVAVERLGLALPDTHQNPY
jgi:Bacterial RNA polymerase, alpha chain C terminal domain